MSQLEERTLPEMFTTPDVLPAVTYGFIGLGTMGYHMARNLRSKIPGSSTLVVCEINTPRLERFIAETEGLLKVAKTPKEVAELADIIITSLPSSAHVDAVFTDSSTGLLSSAAPTSPKFFIESSTISVSTSLSISKVTARHGIFIDAPVSGGPNGASAATLTFMVGCPAPVFPLARTVCSTMGKPTSIFHCGDIGAGLATKQINNYLSAVCMLGVSEAMNMGVRCGLDPAVLAGVINVSSGRCYNSEDQNPVKGVTKTAAAAKDYQGGFEMGMCKGVVDMAVELGKEVGAKSVLSGVVQKTFGRAAESDLCKGLDCRSVYRLFSENEGKGLDGLEDLD